MKAIRRRGQEGEKEGQKITRNGVMKIVRKKGMEGEKEGQVIKNGGSEGMTAEGRGEKMKKNELRGKER